MELIIIQPNPAARNGLLRIDGAKITYRNFEGRRDRYNSSGEKSFGLIIDDEEIAQELTDQGWNVKIKPPREDGDIPFMFLPVKVKFNFKGPHIYLKTGDRLNALDEESVGVLDSIDIANVDMDVRPYDWEMNGNTGRTAYLQSMRVVQMITDRFAEEYENSKIKNVEGF